ncbi:hypothetical protein [Stakelama tenebrarum]|uniref:Uncharacterized protein n=1 Tax=Stakelama tenebrarum TaxID=2711215 RepID=A0A6G6Y8P4_9SPHN|nr:hypothetical protein [Sphingosinithalassobacter tenebrarum]QIG81312.1 hypothetical protein G5C33_17000 [Sphingosinithalassobacter tenebrarum]
MKLPIWLPSLAILALAACDDDSLPNPAPMPTQAANDSADAPPPAEPTPEPDPSPGPDPTPDAVSGTLSERYRGLWTFKGADCGPASVSRLRIDAAKLVFYESVGELRGIEPAGPNAVRITLDFTGEGDSWTAAMTLTLNEDGTLRRDQEEMEPMTYVRCAE